MVESCSTPEINIFVLGEDNESKLREFLDGPYAEIPEEIIRQYTFEGWLEKVMGQIKPGNL